MANYPEVTWEMMANLNYETGEMEEIISQFNNEKVTVAGFIVPLEMDIYIDKVKDFFLVPNPLACIHVPPPPPNQIIYVKMKKSIPLDMDLRGVEIKGVLTVTEPEKNIFTYEVDGISAKEAEIDYEDALSELINH